jgi:putative DNA primase/helicase
MTHATQRIITALRAKKVGQSCMAHCLGHKDATPSMSISEKKGKTLVHCHAGCPQSVLIAALKARGLWPEGEHRGYPSNLGELVATYDYTDAVGKLLYQVCRFQPKNFRPRYPNDRGGWTWRKHPHNQVLYHLPEVLEAPIVFVVEGEKDVESLRVHGFVATTNAGGAKAPWLDSYTEALRGREVILIPDRDAPGRARVLRVARALRGHVARLTLLELEGAKDVSEWFERGHSELELIAQLDGEGVTR